MTLQDSGLLDNALELLVRGGRDIRHAMHMLVPDAWETRDDVPPDLAGFYRYHSCLIEPWDGPAGLVWTDGIRVGACLDRNGLRPLRAQICEDGLVVVSSEVGTVDLDGPRRRHARQALRGTDHLRRPDARRRTPSRTTRRSSDSSRPHKPYAEWAERLQQAQPRHAGRVDVPDDLVARQAAFGVTKEEITVIVEPMAKYRKEPTSSMGDDTQAPFLTTFARPLFNFFKQRFAQVTNPPIDHLRERLVMSKRTLVGPRSPLLTRGAGSGRPLRVRVVRRLPGRASTTCSSTHAVGPAHPAALIDATFPAAEGPDGLEAALRRLGDDAEDARQQRCRRSSSCRTARRQADRAPIPSLAAIGAVHHTLVRAGLRTQASIVCDSGEPRETHHFAMPRSATAPT